MIESAQSLWLIPVWFALACVTMAVVEYAVHRGPMHARRSGNREAWESHAVLHHGRFFPAGKFEHPPDRAARYVSIDLQPGYTAVGLSPIWLALYFLVGPVCGLTFAFTFGMHGYVWTTIHREMHYPEGRWFSRTRYYRYLRDYHMRHHEQPGGNFAVIFPPFLDLLFGTYRGIRRP
jgi:hypothetical protein